MRLFLLTLAALSSLALAATQTDPVSCARDYYRLLQNRRLAEAYELRSDRSRLGLSLTAFREQWSNVLTMSATGFRLEEATNDVDPALVTFTMRTVEFDRKTGKREEIEYACTATMLREVKVWWVDDVEVKKLSVLPYTGLELDPGQEVVKGPTPEPLPDDVPFYAGFKRSPPLLVRDARNPNGVRKLLSLNRQKNLHPSLIVDFYKQTMTAQGWTHDGGKNFDGGMKVSFAKADRKFTVIIYKGVVNAPDALPDPRGVRLELQY